MCPRKLYNYIPTPEEEEFIFEPEHIFCSKACGYRHIITKAALCLLCPDKLSAIEQGSWEFVVRHSLLIGDSPVGLECFACPNRLTRVHDVNECLVCLRKYSEYQNNPNDYTRNSDGMIYIHIIDRVNTVRDELSDLFTLAL